MMTVTDATIIAVVGFISSLIAIVAPVIKLNTNITKLNTNFENMMKNDEVRDRRIEKHGKEIDEIKAQQKRNEKLLDRHEIRLGMLEECGNYERGHNHG